MLRITTAWLILCAITVLVAGCGGGGRGVNVPITREQAVVLGHAVNLRAGDVPRLVAAAAAVPLASRSGPIATEVERCDGGPVETGKILGIRSQVFQTNNAAVRVGTAQFDQARSAAFLMGSPSVASRYLAAADGARGRACIKRYVAAGARRAICGGERGGREVAESCPHEKVDVSLLASPIPGATLYGLRVESCAAIFGPCAKSLAKMFRDLRWFAVGRLIVALSASGSPRPFPLATEQRLLSLLYSRAEAHKLS
jgi:hypothetical protein